MRISLPFWGTGAKLEKLKKQIGELERRIQQMQEQYGQEVADLQQKLTRLDNPLVIEYVYVDRITVDGLELQNNFGALGIRELGGTLNVGVNCAGGRPPGAGKILPPEEKQKVRKPFAGQPPPPAGRRAAGPDRCQKGPEREGKTENGLKKETKSSFSDQERTRQSSSRGGPDAPENPPGDKKSGPAWNIRYGL